MARPLTEDERKARKKDFLNVFKETHGLVYTTCEKIGIEPQTYYNWRENDEDFAKKCDEVRSSTGDLVKGKLMEKILDGDRASIMFYLKTQCHWRETNRLEVEQVGDFDVKAAIQEIKKQITSEQDGQQ